MIELTALPRPEALVARALPHGLPVVRDLVRQRIVDVFGEPPLDAGVQPGDPGLFGPGSPSWRLLADPAAIAGGVRGLMLQTMHPGAMAGVHDHSVFSGDPLGRLRRTTAWVVTSAFGSVDEVLVAARHVRRAHRVVRGTTPAGRPYAAEDPHLLAWVQCCLTTSFLATDAAYAAEPLDQDERDRFVREQSYVGALLDPAVDLDDLDHARLRAGEVELPMVAEGVLPTTEEALDDVMAAFDWELEVGPQARGALRFLALPPLPPLLRAAYASVYVAAVASFDRRTRRRLGLPLPLPVPIAQAGARVHLAALRTAAGRSHSIVRAEARALAA